MARASIKPPELAAIPALVPQGQHAGKQSMPISRPLTVIGSRHRAHLHLLSRSVSKSHAVVGSQDGGVYIRDLASRTHVFVNGKLIREADLRDGDLIKIGSFTFKFTDKRKGPLLEKSKRPTAAAIEVDGGAVPIEFNGRVMLIGRRPTSDISLMEMSVSTCHAVIFEYDGQRYIRDLGSRTGTFLNGQLVHQAPFNVGDQLRIGETDMKLVPQGAAALADLEDLVGTAPLGEEMIALAGEDFAPPPAAKVKPPAAKAKPAPARQAPPPAPPAPPKREAPEPKPDFELEPLPLESADVQSIQAEPVAEAEAVEIGKPPALPLEFPAPVAEPAAPAATAPPSEPEPSHVADVIKIEPDEPPHLLVDANLYSEAMSASGTFTGISGEVEQPNSEAALDAAATEPIDLGLDFWHDEASATPPAQSPADSAAAPTIPEPPLPDEAPLPLFGVEEPDDFLVDELPIAEKPSAASAAEPVRPIAQSASAPEASPEPPPLEPSAAEPVTPVELGPQLTSPAPAAVAAESVLPGLVVPPGAIERDAEIAPPIPSVVPHPAAAADVPPESPPAEEFDLSHVQFAPEESEPVADWETEEPESAAPTSLLGLDISPPAAATPAAAELSLPPAIQESEDVLAGPAEAESTDLAEPPAKPAKPKRKPRRRKKAETEAKAAEIIPAEPMPTERPAPAEPAASRDVIAELEPLAESAAEPSESYSSPAPLVEPISEADKFTPESIELPVEENGASTEPLAPMEESFEPALDLESLAADVESPIENDSELVEIDDSLEFNFDQSADGSPQVTAEGAGPAWIADAQTRLPEARQEHTFEPRALGPMPEEEPELPLPAITESRDDAAPPAPAAAETPALQAKAPHPPDDAAAKMDPFRGMGNDLGSFIGGRPLPLPSAKVPVDDGSSLTFPKPPLVPIAPLDVSEPPPELFDAQPEALDALPEALEKIEDVEQAIGNQPPPGTRPTRLPPWPRRDGGGGVAPFGSTPLSPGVPNPPGVIAGRKGKLPVTARRGQVTTAFDGLALQPVRQADVFSHLNPPDMDEAFALGADAPVAEAGNGAAPPMAPPTSLTGAPPDVPPEPGKRTSRAYLDRKGLRPVRAGRGGEMVDADLVNADPSASDFGGPGVEQRGSMPRRPISVQPGAPAPQFQPMPAAPGAPGMPAPSRSRRRLRLRVGILLPLMLLVAIAWAAAIWFGMPVIYTHAAALRYSNLHEVTEENRQEFIKRQYKKAGSADALALAQGIYTKTGRVGLGFLNPSSSPASSKQLTGVLDSMNIPVGTDTLLITLNSNDEYNDAARLNALVHALGEKDATLRDQAGRAEADLKDSQSRQTALQNQIKQLTDKRQVEQDAHDQLQALKDAYDQENSKVSQLYDNWQSAQRQRGGLEQELRFLETSGAGASNTQSAQASAQPDDTESKTLAAKVAQIQSQLTAIQSKNNSTAEQANAALGQALQQFHQKVTEAQAKLQDGSALGNYLTSAQSVQQAIQDQRAEVTEEEKTFQQHLTEMKDQLATLQKHENEAIWTADPQLHNWEQDLDIKQHHYEAAAGSGLEDDAARIKADMDKLEAQISSRRDQLTAQNPSTATIASIQKLIDGSLAERAREQTRDDKRMADEISQLAAAAPKLSELPADQKALAQDLEKQQEQLDQARQQYALALQSGPQLEGTTKQLESQLTDLTAKLSAHRKELLEENRKISSDAQAQVVENQIKDKEAQLAVAKQQEADALIAYEQSQAPLAAANRAWQNAVTLDRQLGQDEASLGNAHQDLDQVVDEVNEDEQKVGQSIDPESLPENAVTTSASSDQRFEYIAAVFAICLLASLLLGVMGERREPTPPLARLAGVRPPQSALPPRPVIGGASVTPPPLGDPPGKLTSLTAALDGGADSTHGTDEPSSPDAIPAGF